MTTLALPAFNPITFAKRLKDAGVPEKQAEAEAEVLHDALTQQAQAFSSLENKFTAFEGNAKRDAEQMATKGDVALVKQDVALVKADIALVRKEIAIARRDTIIWLGGMLIAGFGMVLTALFKLLG